MGYGLAKVGLHNHLSMERRCISVYLLNNTHLPDKQSTVHAFSFDIASPTLYI